MVGWCMTYIYEVGLKGGHLCVTIDIRICWSRLRLANAISTAPRALCLQVLKLNLLTSRDALVARAHDAGGDARVCAQGRQLLGCSSTLSEYGEGLEAQLQPPEFSCKQFCSKMDWPLGV